MIQTAPDESGRSGRRGRTCHRTKRPVAGGGADQGEAKITILTAANQCGAGSGPGSRRLLQKAVIMNSHLGNSCARDCHWRTNSHPSLIQNSAPRKSETDDPGITYTILRNQNNEVRDCLGHCLMHSPHDEERLAHMVPSCLSSGLR